MYPLTDILNLESFLCHLNVAYATYILIYHG
jgi:hypothetical protein